MHLGSPATFDRALAFIDGFEMALDLSHGRQPRLHEYNDVLPEIRQLLERDPPDAQESEAIDALEPILVQVYRAVRAAKAN